MRQDREEHSVNLAQYWLGRYWLRLGFWQHRWTAQR